MFLMIMACLTARRMIHRSHGYDEPQDHDSVDIEEMYGAEMTILR